MGHREQAISTERSALDDGAGVRACTFVDPSTLPTDEQLADVHRQLDDLIARYQTRRRLRGVGRGEGPNRLAVWSVSADGSRV